MKFKRTLLKSGSLRRLLSTVLAVTFVAGLLPVSALATGASGRPDPEYSRAKPEVGILNAYTGTSTALYKEIRTAASSYTYSADRYDAFPDLFGVLGTFLGTDSYDWKNNFAGHTTYAQSTLRELSKVYGNLEVNISATLVNDPHTHTHAKGLSKYKYSITDYEKVYLQIGSYTPVYLAGVYPEANKDSKKPMVGDYDGVSNENMSSYAKNSTDSYGIVRYSDDTTFQVKFVGMDFTYDHFGDKKTCTCNHTSADFPMMTFRDARSPQVAGVYYSLDGDTNWTPSTSGLRVKEDSTLRIKLCFDEPIRFADDSKVGKGDLFLELQADRSSTGYENRKAYLTELNGNDLYFTYNFTEDNVDWNIQTLNLSNLFGNDLKLVQVDGGTTFEPRYIPAGDKTGFTTTTCYITDLAGNAMQTQTISSGDLKLDSKKPYVENVQFNLTLNNAEVKEARGKTNPSDTDYTDDSDLYLGVGDSVSMVLNMNERLKVNTVNGSTAVATTNIKDKSGNFVTVTSRYFTPESERISADITTWVMNPITMQEGWTVADSGSQIKVTALQLTGGSGEITDLAGNALDKSSVEILASANANPPRLDVTPPEVTALSGSYAAEDAGFRYGINISDTKTQIAGTRGSFILKNGGDGKSYSYEYAVTADGKTTEKTVWETGVAGISQPFLQHQNTYIHIRPKAGVTYGDLSACTLVVTAKDYAGNGSAALTLPPEGTLAWYIDNLAPTVKAGNTTRRLNATPNTGGTLTAEVVLTDSNGISAWQYAWGDSNTTAPTTGWEPGAVTATTGTAPVTVTVTKDVTNGTALSEYLWIKATDNSESKNASAPISLGKYTYDLRIAQYNLDYSTGITRRAQMNVSSIASDSALFFLVKEKTATESANDEYALLCIITPGDFNHDIFDVSGWYYGYTIAKDSNGFYTLTKASEGTALQSTISAVRNSTYSGELTVQILSGKNLSDPSNTIAGNFETGFTLGNSAYLFSKDTVTLKAAGYTLDSYEGISITSSSTMGGTYNAAGNSYNVTLVAPARSTPAGIEFTISIARDKNGWEYKDINWAESYVELQNISTSTSCRFNLRTGPVADNGSTTQTLTIPEGDYETGYYTAVLYLKCFAGRDPEPQQFQLSDGRCHFVVDTTKPNSDFSLTALTYTPGELRSKQYGIEDYYGTLDCLGNAENGVITLPVADADGGTFGTGYPGNSYRFTISSPTEPDLVTNANGYKLQMWNTADAANKLTITPILTEGSQKTVQNNHGTYYTDGRAYGFVFKEDAAVTGQYLYLTPDQENIVAMQKVYLNGLKSEIKYIHIKPVKQHITGSLRVDAQTRELVFTPTNAASTNGAKIYAWAWQDNQSPLDGEGTRIDMTPASDGTWRCALAENGANYKVITVNSAGSICDAGSISELAPEVTFSPSTPDTRGAYELSFRVKDGIDTMRNGITLDIGFNEAYATDHLSFTVKEGSGLWTKGWSPDHSVYQWTETGVSTTGIYSVDVIKYSNTGTDYLGVTVKGCFKDVTEGTPMNMTLTAMDALGQTSAGSSGNITVNYKNPEAYTGTGNPDWDPKLGENGLILTFTQPVRPVDSWAWQEADASVTGFRTQWEGAFPIIGNGTYELQFVDIFGKTCTQELTTNAFTTIYGKDYSVKLSFSDSDLTSEPVTVTASVVGRPTPSTPNGYLTFWGDVDGYTVPIWQKDGEYKTTQLINQYGGWPEEPIHDPNDDWNPIPEEALKNIGATERAIRWETNGKMKILYDSVFQSGEPATQIFTQTVYIGNIAAAAPKAEVRYFIYGLGEEFTQKRLEQYIADNGGSVTVTGNVEVWYKTTRTVTPTDGGSQFLFTPENYQAGHTFIYKDDLGNTGSETVTLPEGLTLAEPTKPPVDNTAPAVSVDIYTKVKDAYTQAEAFTFVHRSEQDSDEEYEAKQTAKQAEIAQKFAELGYVQGYSLMVNASDASGYDIALTDGEGRALSADSGATLSGNVITISKAGTFTITVTDRSSNHNATSATFTVPEKIDNEAPKAKIALDAPNSSLYKKTLIIEFSDTYDGEHEIVSPEGADKDTVALSLPTDATRIDKNKYTYEITDNRTVEFVFFDLAGNRGTASYSVSGIDTEPPKLTVEWSPPFTYQDSEGNTYVIRSEPTSGPVNTDVTARIKSDKAMQDLSMTIPGEPSTTIKLLKAGKVTTDNPYIIKHPQTNETLVTVTGAPELITVTYSGNYGQKLKFTATTPNGKSTDLTLNGLRSIDKTAPTITQTPEPLKRSKGENGTYTVPYGVKVTLTPDETVTSPNYGATRVVDNVRRPVQYDDGYPLILTFTEDGTYNVRFADAAGNVTIVPVVISGVDNTAPKLTISKSGSESSSSQVTVTATVYEPCTLTWGESGTHTFDVAGDHSINFTENGTYVFTATDHAGNKSSKSIRVGSIDGEAPSISFDKNTIYLMEGSSADELTAALGTGYTVRDNVTAANALTVGINHTIDLNTADQYIVTYTVTDKAGNVTTANRFVRVIGSDTVCLNVDGNLILPNSTAVLHFGEHTLSVENNNGEPYSVKARKGVLSAGQMKYITGNSLSFDENGKFSVSSTGYYTLLVTTQSRQTIRILLYVEQ